jgi:predicted ATPase
MTRISKIGLRNWKNFSSAVGVLQNRVFIAGPNASGKSNLLDALWFLHDLVAIGGGFQEAVRSRGGVQVLRSNSAKRSVEVEIDVDVTDTTTTNWRYLLSFNQDRQRRPIVQQERIWRDAELVLDRPGLSDRTDEARLFQTHLEQSSANAEFRALAKAIGGINQLHLVPQMVRNPDRLKAARDRDIFGRDFIEQVASTPERTRASRLRRIVQSLGGAIPQIADLKIERDVYGVAHLLGRIDARYAADTWQSEQQLSDGTIRLIGLLWAVLDGRGPLLLEEPELSLHSDVVAGLPSLIYGFQRESNRQVIMSTHSRDIFREDGIALDEILLLMPGESGTEIAAASDLPEIASMLDRGVSLTEVIAPYSAPRPTKLLVSAAF